MNKLTLEDKIALAEEFQITLASLEAIIEVESGGRGFDPTTGKIIIQFEPAWYKKKSPYTPSGKWSLNKVENQKKEWEAFNDAFSKDANAAMESTSVGLMQVMGFQYKLLGFKTVGAMWDFAKESEKNQVKLGLLFIKSNKALYNALKKNDFATVAYFYNGKNYKVNDYDTKLENAYKKHLA